MPKIENSTSVTLYIQCISHTVANPQIPQHRIANSKWALARIKEILMANSVDFNDVKLIVQDSGLVLLEILEPDLHVENAKEFWEYILSILKQSSDIVSISILVNNDMSEKIALNLADRVPTPWHSGYKGYYTTTTIYHC